MTQFILHYLWGGRFTASLHGLPNLIPLIHLIPCRTCFPQLYSCYTCLIPFPIHSRPLSFYTCLHHIPPLPLTAWFSGCECRASRLTCHALKWISCGIFLLRSVFGKKKRQVKRGRCPDKASVNPKQASGKGADDRERSFT